VNFVGKYASVDLPLTDGDHATCSAVYLHGTHNNFKFAIRRRKANKHCKTPHCHATPSIQPENLSFVTNTLSCHSLPKPCTHMLRNNIPVPSILVTGLAVAICQAMTCAMRCQPRAETCRGKILAYIRDEEVRLTCSSKYTTDLDNISPK
jgi:hypothetical protein